VAISLPRHLLAVFTGRTKHEPQRLRDAETEPVAFFVALPRVYNGA